MNAEGHKTSMIHPRQRITAAALVASIAAVKLLVHLYAGRHYGYFVDELYYLACSRHLDWGYVDQPPLIALIAWVGRHLFGQSLAAIRFLPAVAGAAEIVLTAVLARALGGGRFAQALAAIAALAAPGILGLDNLLSMNAFEPLFWMACAWLAVRIIQTGNRKLWIWFGVLAGFGLENKYSMALFAGALVLGLLLTAERRLLASRWLWIGGAIAVLIFLPNLLWNIQHHFPFLELQANIRRCGRDVPLGPLAFFGQETLAMLPLQPARLAGRSLVLLRPAARKTLPRAGMGLDLHRHCDSGAEPAHLLPLPGIPAAVRRRRRDLGILAGAPAPRLAEVRLSGAPAGLRRRCSRRLPFRCSRPRLYIRYAQALHIEQPRHRNPPPGAAAADFRRPVRLGGDDGRGGARL